MRAAAIVGLAVLVCGVAVAQNLPPVVGGSSLKDLVGTQTLVTVVLKESGAIDQNLRVLEVGPDYLGVAADDGERTAYLLKSIQEVRVQSGAAAKRELNLAESQSLRVEEQRVLDRALGRAREIFDAANADQNLKMRAATLLAATGNKEGSEYLEKLAATNHIETELDAYQCLFLAGKSEVPSTVIEEGLNSGNRVIKAKAALIAGLLNDRAAVPALAQMLQDRLAELSAPAAIALARLGWRDEIPTLMRMIAELREEKGDAAVFGLTRLGGPDVIAEAKTKLKTATGQTRYRLITLLYELEDPEAMSLLLAEGLKDPGKALKSAILLAKRGDWTGRQYLTTFLKNKYYDETAKNIVERAEAATALIAANDLTATSELQRLMGINNPAARKQICLLMAELGKRSLIRMIQPLIENADPEVAIEACMAVVAMARPAFHARLVDLMQ